MYSPERIVSKQPSSIPPRIPPSAYRLNIHSGTTIRLDFAITDQCEFHPIPCDISKRHTSTPDPEDVNDNQLVKSQRVAPRWLDKKFDIQGAVFLAGSRQYIRYVEGLPKTCNAGNRTFYDAINDGYGKSMTEVGGQKKL